MRGRLYVEENTECLVVTSPHRVTVACSTWALHAHSHMPQNWPPWALSGTYKTGEPTDMPVRPVTSQ